MDDSKRTMLKIILAGDCQVGKSSLVRRYLGEKFSLIYLPTIAPKYSVKEVNITGVGHVLLQIWDTSGWEEFFSCLGINFYRDADCCVLVYDITDAASFESLNKWFNEFLILASPTNAVNFPFIVVGTKSDLGDSRQVTRREAEQWCRLKSGGSRNFIYLETSAKSSSDVRRLFATIANHVLSLEPIINRNSTEQQLPNNIDTNKQVPLIGFHCCCCTIL